MRKSMISVLAAGQLALGAQPALAATYGAPGQTQLGVFTGVQVRVPLGGENAEPPRASLGIAPMVRSERIDGSSRTMIGEGLQLSVTPDQPVTLNVAGTRLDQFRLSPEGQTPEGNKQGVTTLGWVGIGVGVVVVGIAGFYWWLSEEMECGPGEC